MSKLSIFVQIVKNCQKFSKLSIVINIGKEIVKSCKDMIVKNYQNCQNKDCQNYPINPKILKKKSMYTFQTISIKGALCIAPHRNFLPSHSTYSHIAFLATSVYESVFVRSCFLITLTKCIKGYCSLRLLFDVKK